MKIVQSYRELHKYTSIIKNYKMGERIYVNNHLQRKLTINLYIRIL